MKSKFIKGLLAGLFTATLSFADSIILSKNRATYIQEEIFMVAEGENILGPVALHPLNTLDIVNIKIKDENAKILDYIYEPSSLNWKESLVGKEVIIGGEGILIKGKVINIKDNFITLETKQGVVVLPFPKFPAKINIKKNYSDSTSPKITFKVLSKSAGEKVFEISYPIKGVSYSIRYILSDGVLNGYIVIENKTAFTFSSVDVVISPLKKKFENLMLPAGSKKLILIDKKDILPDGIVFIYEKGEFKGTTRIKNGKLIK